MSGSEFPEDVYEESWCRLPLVKRDELTPGAKELFDMHIDPNGDTYAGMRGPGGVRLHSPLLAELARPAAKYLRHDTGLDSKIREVAAKVHLQVPLLSKVFLKAQHLCSSMKSLDVPQFLIHKE